MKTAEEKREHEARRREKRREYMKAYKREWDKKNRPRLYRAKRAAYAKDKSLWVKCYKRRVEEISDSYLRSVCNAPPESLLPLIRANL